MSRFLKWGALKGFSKYEVSTAGDVQNITTGQLLKPNRHKSGYYKIKLVRDDGKHVTFYLHRLVAEVFIPNPEGKPEVNHKDGNKKHNSIYNLEWTTREENMMHAQLNGFGHVKLKPVEVRSIYYLAWASNMTQKDIAKMYGVRRSIVSEIKWRKSWEFVLTSEVINEMGLFE